MKITYIRRGAESWRLRIEDGVNADGSRKFRYETIRGTEEDAQRRRFAILQAHDEGSWAAPEKVTFGAFFEQWVDNRLALGKTTRTTAENYRKMYQYYLRDTIGGLRLQRVTAQNLQSIYSEMAKRGLSMTTINHVHVIAGACIRAARRAKLLKSNIMEEVEAPAANRSKPKALDESAAVELLQSIEGHWMEPIVALALATGLRRGEVLGLRWSDIDLAGARLHVRGQMKEYQDGSTEWSAPKTESALRTVSLGQDAVEMLKRLRAAAAERRMALGLGGKLDEAPVFTLDNPDRHIRPGTLTHAFGAKCNVEGFSFHGLRHTHITTLLQRVGKAGAKAVSQRVGHADVTTTLSIYQTVFEEDDRALADLSSGLIRRR